MNSRSRSSVCYSIEENLQQNPLSMSYHSQGGDSGLMQAVDPHYAAEKRSSLNPDEKDQELIDLKLQVATQQEKLDLLAFKLCQAMVEVTALKAEKSTLIDELTIRKGGVRSKRHSTADGTGGSMQMLIDKNSHLEIDNRRLKVENDIISKSFKSYISNTRRHNSVDKERIDNLVQDNEALHRRLFVPKQIAVPRSSTEETSIMESFDVAGEAENVTPDDSSWHSLLTPPATPPCKRGEGNAKKRSRRSTMPDMPVLCAPVGGNTHGFQVKPIPLESAGNYQKELLVDFVPSRRVSKIGGRRWSNL